MKEAENASIFFGFENVFAVGNLKSFHIYKQPSTSTLLCNISLLSGL